MGKTIKNSIEHVKSWRKASNEERAKIVDHLYALESTEVWKKDSYYKGSPDLLKLKEASFKTFLKEAFGITHLWFCSMKNIFAYNEGEGRTLFIKYGRANMVTFLNSTPEEREKILEHAESSVVTRKFWSIKASLFPQRKKKAPINMWKERYIKLKKEFKEYKAMVEKEFESMRHTIAILSRGHEPEEKKADET